MNQDLTVNEQKLSMAIEDFENAKNTLNTTKDIDSSNFKKPTSEGLKDSSTSTWKDVFNNGNQYFAKANEQISNAIAKINAATNNFNSAIDKKRVVDQEKEDESKDLQTLIDSGRYSISLKNTKTFIAEDGVTSMLTGTIVATSKKTGKQIDFDFEKEIGKKETSSDDNSNKPADNSEETPQNDNQNTQPASQPEQKPLEQQNVQPVQNTNNNGGEKPSLTPQSRGRQTGTVSYSPRQNSSSGNNGGSGASSASGQTANATPAASTNSTDTTTSNKPITSEDAANETTDLFDDGAELLDDTPTKSTSSSGGSVIGAVAAAAGIAGAAGIGVKLYKDRRENSDLDLDEDRPTNDNKFWTDEDSNVINSEKESYGNSDTLDNGELKPLENPKYKASDNGYETPKDEDKDLSNDTWEMPDKNVNLFGN